MKILYVVNNAAFFCSHRLPLALTAIELGFEVGVLTGQAGSETLEGPALRQLRELGISHRVVSFQSGGLNLARELIGLIQMVSFMRKWRPDIIHCASPKGNLYGGIAARISRANAVVFAISGMGSLFVESKNLVHNLVKFSYATISKFAYGHRNKCVIVQNNDDYRMIISNGLASPDEIILIPGSGVYLAKYIDLPITSKRNLVVLPARLIRDKGVEEFVKASCSLRQKYSDWKFALVGTADYKNPSAFSVEQINKWVEQGSVEWWGHRANMVDVYRDAAIVCLPSYREGMPKCLLESAAAGCAVVTTDTIGCREAILPGKTGELIPVRNVQALEDALESLILDKHRRELFGRRGRELAIQRFGIDSVVRSTHDIYSKLHSLVKGKKYERTSANASVERD